MPKPIEFSDFYKLIHQIKKGDEAKEEELERLLEDYKIGKHSESAYEELGKMLCNIGLKGTIEYSGLKKIDLICKLEQTVWNYLEVRMSKDLKDYLIGSMKSFVKKDNLVKIIATKWKVSESEFENNVEGLAIYITDGILEIVQ